MWSDAQVVPYISDPPGMFSLRKNDPEKWFGQITVKFRDIPCSILDSILLASYMILSGIPWGNHWALLFFLDFLWNLYQKILNSITISRVFHGKGYLSLTLDDFTCLLINDHSKLDYSRLNNKTLAKSWTQLIRAAGSSDHCSLSWSEFETARHAVKHKGGTAPCRLSCTARSTSSRRRSIKESDANHII